MFWRGAVLAYNALKSMLEEASKTRLPEISTDDDGRVDLSCRSVPGAREPKEVAHGKRIRSCEPKTG